MLTFCYRLVYYYACSMSDNDDLASELNVPDSVGKLPTNEQDQQINKYVLENDSITTAKVMELLGVKQRRAREILSKMIECGWLNKEGASKRTIYVKNTEWR